jgi:hypothetical protein
LFQHNDHSHALEDQAKVTACVRSLDMSALTAHHAAVPPEIYETGGP